MAMKRNYHKHFMIIALMATLHLPSLAAAADEVPLMDILDVTNQLMSPGCDYLYTLTDCPSEDAKQMREIVKDRLANGESRDTIIKSFEEIYGPKILAHPPTRGFFLFAWWFPFFLLADVMVLAAVILYVWKKRSQKEFAAQDLDAATAAPVDAQLEDSLEQEVRRFREDG